MLLRNYDNIITAKKRMLNSQGYASTDKTTFGDGHINMKTPNGSIQDIYICDYNYFEPFSVFLTTDVSNYGYNRGYSNLMCGGGNTPVTYDDYKLDAVFTSTQVTYASGDHRTGEPVYDETDNSWTFTYSRTFKANEAITVKEIGVGYNFHYSSSSTAGSLLYRKVLDTPIEVPANANFVLSFTTKVYANPNKPANYDASVTTK